MKTSKHLERYFKGVANHRRLDILFLVSKSNGMTLKEITKELGCHIATASEHTRRLVSAGLLNKKYRGREVEHSLSPYGKMIVRFTAMF